MLIKLESWLQSLTSRQFIFFIVALTSVRVGISPIGKEWFGWLLDAAHSFPSATSYISYSPIPVILLKSMGISSPYIWWFLWFTVDFSWILFCLYLISKKYSEFSRVLQLIFLMSQSVMLNLTMIGHYDNIILIAGTLLIFYDKKLIFLFSAIIVGGANPNIGLASGICFFFYYLYTKNDKHFMIATSWITINLIYLVGTHILYVSPASGTREKIVLGQIGYVISGVAGVWWFIPLALFGPLTIIYLILISDKVKLKGSNSNIRSLSLLMATLIIPLTMSYFILDHTRIGVSSGGIVTLMFIFENISQIRGKFEKIGLPILSSLILIWLITPPLIIDSGGVFRLPYAKYLLL